jgi:hypothetical protein
MKVIASVLSGLLLLSACSSDPDKQAKEDCETLQNLYADGYITFPDKFNDGYQRDQLIFSSAYGSMKDPKTSNLVKQISDLSVQDYPNWDWVAKRQDPPAKTLINAIWSLCSGLDIELGTKIENW